MKHKNNMHAPAALQKLHIRLFGFELSKLRLRGHYYNLFERFFKNWLIKCIIDEAGDVVGTTPEGMGH